MCYVLANPAHTDIALLDDIARRNELPAPFRDLGAALGRSDTPPRAWCFLNRRMGWLLTRFVPVDHPRLLAAIMSSDVDVALVPVSIVCGRAPGKHGSLLRALVS